MPYNSADEWPNDPHNLFHLWMQDAEKNEPNDPNAMCLSTIGPENMPNSRMVLLKGYDKNGFIFYTNSESQKGRELAANMKAALCLYWKSLRKQVRIQGMVECISAEQADIYFNSRHPDSQIGAWASQQSRPLSHREVFDQRFTEFKKKFEGCEMIPRPDYWNGYRVTPQKIEFWINETHRLHRRCIYKLQSNGDWERDMLYP